MYEVVSRNGQIPVHFRRFWMYKRCIFGLLFIALTAYGFAVGEKKLTLGGREGWNRIALLDRVNAAGGMRPFPVLLPVLAEPAAAEQAFDMALRFDEIQPRRYRDAAGNYTVSASPGVNHAPVRWAHSGTGAAVFSNDGKAFITVKSASPDALFSEGNRFGSFTVEFFLFPKMLDSNSEIFAWNAQNSPGKAQLIRASLVKNKVSVAFEGFFASPDNQKTIDLRLSSKKLLVPEQYSHHVIQFDRNTGLIEYYINDVLEDVRHTTESGRENGEIYEPLVGKKGEFVIGRGFNGIIDDFLIQAGHDATPTASTAAAGGRNAGKAGWIESLTLDLGESSARVIRADAFGGFIRTGPGGKNTYSGSIRAEAFPDSSAMQFFIRARNTPYGWEDTDWRAFVPGKDLAEAGRGRYVQVAVAFYAGDGGKSHAYLESLSLVYTAREPPAPPAMVTAEAGDKSVTLNWRANRDPATAGYRIYMGTKSGEYWEAGPIDAGNGTSWTVDGLTNGVLYYFVISAYDESGQIDGIFSRELRARPLSGIGTGAGGSGGTGIGAGIQGGSPDAEKRAG